MNKFSFKNFLTLFAILTMVGCSSSAPVKKKPPTTPRPLACHAGELAFVNIYGPENAELALKGRKHELKRKNAEHGLLYVKKGVSVWNKGLNYTILNGRDEYNCKPLPTLSQAN